MNPAMLMKLGLGGMAAYLAYKFWESKQQPKPSDYQAVTVPSATGMPITVATPVAPTVTEAQATGNVSLSMPSFIPSLSSLGMPTAAPMTITQAQSPASVPISPPGPPPAPVPITTNEGTTYAPPNTVQVTPSGDVTQPAPIVVTPAGSSSIAVGNTLDVQRALNTLGYTPKLVEDGKLGAKTTANIKAFQAKSHLTVDGVAGPATKVALSAALAMLAGSSSIPGMTAQFSAPQTGIATMPTGTTIDTTPALNWGPKNVQHALNVLGASPKLAEDGKTGAKTVAAIKSFQTANGLTPDGVAGPKTKTALYVAMSQIHPTGASGAP
jgi:peptidoglycan hydrolase-like protein with peptidoglycan-binding domain